MPDPAFEHEIRRLAMAWLDERTRQGHGFRLFASDELRRGFTVGDQPIPFLGPQQGIWKPRILTAALSIRTAYTPPGASRPYDDVMGGDGCLRYKYRGVDPLHSDNRALRAALDHALPLIWFWGVAPAIYEAIRPVWLIAEEEQEHQFVVGVDQAQRSVTVGAGASGPERRYVEHLTKQRVHQPIFRAQVITQYRERCAMCRLSYPSLLDAAHILPDGHPRGDPVVPNGISLCKIHHAAFDGNLVGIHPTRLVVEVRPEVRAASDGPMLVHGLQAMQGVELLIPAARASRPDPSRLEERWEQFRRAG